MRYRIEGEGLNWTATNSNLNAIIEIAEEVAGYDRGGYSVRNTETGRRNKGTFQNVRKQMNFFGFATITTAEREIQITEER